MSMKVSMKRIFDFFTAMIILVLLLPLCLGIAIAVKLTSKGSVLYWSKRVGRDNVQFNMPKFRTMINSTPVVATHLLSNVDSYLTPIGLFLRRTSLDELPQLWSILIGNMSFVGPRPALFNQDDLISLRSHNGLDQLTPGLTGWAQIKGRDELSIPVKVQYEIEYLENISFLFDLKILYLTIIVVIQRSGISH